jgi:YfiR/HmsC-like
MGHRRSVGWLTLCSVLRSPYAFCPLLGASLLLTLFSGVCLAQKDVPLEYRVKATFLYNFTKFVTWPLDALLGEDPPLKIVIVGDDPFGPVLDELASNATPHGPRLVIERRSRNQDLRHCHILFISRSEKRHLKEILASVKGASVLTVSEIDQFAESGGMIGFVFDQDQVRFEINLDAATQARVEISSRLLSLAISVRHRPSQSGN